MNYTKYRLAVEFIDGSFDFRTVNVKRGECPIKKFKEMNQAQINSPYFNTVEAKEITIQEVL